MGMDSILRTAINSAREIFGNDITMMIARCPSWGHGDCCIIVNGMQHLRAARSMATIIDSAQHQVVESVRFNGESYSYSTVTFPRNKE
jgi:hypothetical protein